MSSLQLSLLPSDVIPTVQLISQYRFFELLERVLGSPLSEADKKWFDGCRSVEDFIPRMLTSNVFDKVALKHNPITQANVVELYVCLRCDMRWEPRPGFDIWGALEYKDMIEAGKVEVKHGGPGRSAYWNVQITGREKSIKADVLVFLGMPHSYNPCEGALLVIPTENLQTEVDRQLSLNPDRIPTITISKNRIHSQGGMLNKWYDHELRIHTQLRELIAQYVHGDFTLVSQQLMLPFDFGL